MKQLLNLVARLQGKLGEKGFIALIIVLSLAAAIAVAYFAGMGGLLQTAGGMMLIWGVGAAIIQQRKVNRNKSKKPMRDLYPPVLFLGLYAAGWVLVFAGTLLLPTAATMETLLFTNFWTGVAASILIFAVVLFYKPILKGLEFLVSEVLWPVLIFVVVVAVAIGWVWLIIKHLWLAPVLVALYFLYRIMRALEKIANKRQRKQAEPSVTVILNLTIMVDVQMPEPEPPNFQHPDSPMQA